MPQFHPIIYSPHEGRAGGTTVEAQNADEACRKAAATLLDLSLPEVDRMMEKAELEVITGDPQFATTRKIRLFPGL